MQMKINSVVYLLAPHPHDDAGTTRKVFVVRFTGWEYVDSVGIFALANGKNTMWPVMDVDPVVSKEDQIDFWKTAAGVTDV